jgi:hypothetical protein
MTEIDHSSHFLLHSLLFSFHPLIRHKKITSTHTPTKQLDTKNTMQNGTRVLLLVATTVSLLSSNPVQAALDNKTVASWSTNFTKFFSNELSTKMRINEVQQVYDVTPRSTSQVDGGAELAAAAARVDTMLVLVEEDLDIFVNEIISSNRRSYFSKTKKSSSTMYRYFVHAANGSVVMEDNADTDQGMKGSDVNRTDARLTPWYSNAVAGPKHLFVVIDLRVPSDISNVDEHFFLKR